MPRLKKILGLRWLFLLSFLLLSCGDDDGLISSGSSQPGLSWSARFTGTTHYLIDAAFSGSGEMFAAVGEGGTIITSPDGLVLGQPASPTTQDLHSITWAKDKFVAVGRNGTILISSSDGQTWTEVETNTALLGTAWLYRVDTSQSLIVAVGQDGTILTSANGTDWSKADSSGTDNHLYGLTWDAATLEFVAVGGAGTILTSQDGNIWTSQESGVSAWLYDVARGDSLYVAVGQHGTILTSPNGEEWTVREGRPEVYLLSVTWSGVEFVAVGESGWILSSPDGISWTLQGFGDIMHPVHLRGLAWSPSQSRFVAVGLDETILTSTSPDGSTWDTHLYGADLDLYGITCFADTDTLCLAAGSHGVILASDDGVTWSLRYRGDNRTVRDLAYRAVSDTAFVGVGDEGKIIYSNDAMTWTTLDDPAIDQQLYGVAASPTRFVAVGNNGTVLYTPDGNTGDTWTAQQVTAEHLYSVAWSDSASVFVAVGDTGTIVNSSDGENWAAAALVPVIDSLRAVAWIDTMFIAVGKAGVILTSGDGSIWQEQEWDTEAGKKAELKGVAYSGSLYVAVGVNENIITSTDGVTWTTLRASLLGSSLEGVFWTGTRFVVVGQDQTILTSP